MSLEASSEWRFAVIPAPMRGGRRQGHVDWNDTSLADEEWPYVAVRGEEDGPAVLLVAGVHGSEYSSVDAAIRIGRLLDPARVRGQVLVLPLLNPAAFRGRAAYVCPIDGLNLNRVFPGRADGSFSERLAWHVTERMVRQADAFIDMHGGDLPEALVPFTIFERTGNDALDHRTEALARAFGQAALIRQDRATAPISGASFAAGAAAGVPSIIVEDGGAGVLDPDASARLVEGAERALRHLGVLEAAPSSPQPSPPRLFDRFVWLRARGGGLFRGAVNVGDNVAAGDVIGEIVDFFGETREILHAPAAGAILFLVVSAAIEPDGLICGLGAAD